MTKAVGAATQNILIKSIFAKIEGATLLLKYRVVKRPMLRGGVNVEDIICANSSFVTYFTIF